MAALAGGAPARVQLDGDDFQVNSYTTNAQLYPSVAGDPNGNFVVVWTSRFQDPDPASATDLFGQRYDSAGMSVESEFAVSSYTTDSQSRPVVATAADGARVLAWESNSQDGSSTGIFARVFGEDGIPRGSELQVNTFTDDAQKRPAIAASGGGRFIVTWHSRKPIITGSVEIFARILDDAGTPVVPEFQVNSYGPNSQLVPQACGTDAGDFVVVWQSGGTFDSSIEQDGSGAGIFGRRFDSAGMPKGDDFLVAQYTTNSQENPAVACAPGGEFVVVWSGYGPGGKGGEVFARGFDAGATPMGPQRSLRTLPRANLPPIDLLFPNRFPQIARASDGSFLVVWADRLKKRVGSGDADIVGQLLTSDGTEALGTNFVLTTYPDAWNHEPSVTLSGDGFVVAWTSGNADYPDADPQDGNGSGVFARRLRRVPECGDATDNGAIAATDALVALETSVGSASCIGCVCDTNSSGDVTATDALAVLQAGVGLDVPLQCVDCE